MAVEKDIHLTCLVCLRTEGDEYYSVFDTDLRTPGMTIFEKIKSCSELTISPEDNDKIPNKICSRCLDDLTATWRFRKNCLKTNKMFAALTQEYEDEQKDIQSKNIKLPTGLKITRVQQSRNYSISNSIIESDGLVEEALSDEVVELESQDDENELEQTNAELEDFNDFYETEEIFEEEINESSDLFHDEKNDMSKEIDTTKDNIKSESSKSNIYNKHHDTKFRRGLAKTRNSNSLQYTNSIAKKCFSRSFNTPNEKNNRSLVVSTSDNEVFLDYNQTSSDADQCFVSQTKSSKKHSAPKICDICGNSYKYQHTLNAHMRRHMNDRPYPCEFCDKSFVSGVEMHRHMRVHTGHKPYSCQHCDRKFSDFGSRVKHERTHTGERPYCCPTCGKTFAYAHVLTVHLRTHTGEKKFQCTQCNKGFTKKVYLQAHLENHARSAAVNERNENLSHITTEAKPSEIEECIITEYIDNDDIESEQLVKLETVDESMLEETDSEYKYVITVQ